MDDDDVQYQEWVLECVEDYYEGLKHQRGLPQASVAYVLDDSISGWTKYPIICIATVVTLSIISIREGFFPDYLQTLLTGLRDVTDLLNNEEKLHYHDDLRTLEVLMKYVPYETIPGGSDWMGIEASIPSSVAK